MQRLRAQAAHPGAGFLLVAADCAERLGEVQACLIKCSTNAPI
jgi:biotin carboxylase